MAPARLINAGQPQRILALKPLVGLPVGDRHVGMDYRVAHGVLFALSASTSTRWPTASAWSTTAARTCACTPTPALRQGGRTSQHLVNLATGAATRIATVGDGRPVWGIAIEP